MEKRGIFATSTLASFAAIARQGVKTLEGLS